MDGGFSTLRSEAAGAVRTALVSAEHLQLTLTSGLSQEEQGLTHATTNGGPEDAHDIGYCAVG